MQDLDLSRIAALAARPPHVLPPGPACESVSDEARSTLGLLAVMPGGQTQQSHPRGKADSS
jgi:hypothetical protein